MKPPLLIHPIRGSSDMERGAIPSDHPVVRADPDDATGNTAADDAPVI
jgi:hypothetical protein